VTEHSAWLAQVIDSIGEAVVGVDTRGCVVTHNAEARRILGLTSAETPCAALWESSAKSRLLDPSGTAVPARDLPLVRALRGEDVAMESYLLSAGEGALPVDIECRAQPLRGADGAIVGAVASFRDVTEKRAIDAVLARDADRLVALAEELDDARRAAERENRYKSRFLAVMSHELRTPLNAVIGLSELLEQESFGPLNPKQTEFVSHVLASGRHLLQIVNDILDLSKVEAGKFEIALEFTPLQPIVDAALAVIEPARAKQGITISVDVPDDLPQLYADSGRLKQVLYNLLSNAVKFSNPGSMVEVSAQAAGGVLEFSVRDHGIGIRREDLPRLFREFEQLATNSRSGGTGLGLALSKRLIELHGGRVGVESEFGQGSRFWARLPILLQDTPAVYGEPVLIVEDDAISARILTQQLAALGLNSWIVENGKLAPEQVERQRPCAIAVDINAETDGRGLIECIKTDPRTRGIPLIAISAQAEMQRLHLVGPGCALHKPFTQSELGRALTHAGVTLPRDAL
jgi:signal transduction histidine kinase